MLAQGTSFGTNSQATTGSANQDPAGQSGYAVDRSPVCWSTPLIDYSPSSQSPSEDRLLLDELTHRVSNELAAAIGIVTAAAARSSATGSQGRARPGPRATRKLGASAARPADAGLRHSSSTPPCICGNSVRRWCLEIELAGDRVDGGRPALAVAFRAVLADGSHRRRTRHEFRAPCFFREWRHHSRRARVLGGGGGMLCGRQRERAPRRSSRTGPRNRRGPHREIREARMDQRFGPRGTRSTLTFPLVEERATR